MSSTRTFVSLLLCCLVAATVQATTFLEIPGDRELIERSQLIATATVEGSSVQLGVEGGFDTIYEMRIARGLKGAVRPGELVRVASPGGEMGNYGSYVPGAAHFRQGEKVVLLLSRQHDRWEFTDFALGAFRYAVAADGEGVLLRDLDGITTIEGGEVVEHARSEARFLRFIVETVNGRHAAPDYNVKKVIDRSTETDPGTGRNLRLASDSLADPKRYTQMGGSSFGVRWSTSAIANGINFFKSTGGDLAGAGDGGVSVIQAALGAWTNDCPSAAVLNYGGTSAKNYGDGTPEFGGIADGVNVVQYNQAIAPAGQASIVFFTTDGGAAGTGFREIIDADVRVNSSITSASLGLATIVTHEIGHGIGWRHSNASPSSPNDSASSCTGSDDCVTNTNGAIMLWQVTNAGNGFTLQPWDIRAVGAVYPGGSCVSLGTPSGLIATGGASSVSLVWNAATGATGYKIYRRVAGGSFTLLNTSVGPSFTDNAVTPGNAYLYNVTATASGSESAASNPDFATVYAFTDPTIIAGVTSPKKAHVDDLRSCVNAMRALANLGNATWTTDPTITVSTTTIKKAHIDELRSQINSVRVTLGFTGATFATDGTLAAGTTLVKKAHIDEMRDAVK